MQLCTLSRIKQLLSNGFLWNSNGLAEYFSNYIQRTISKEYEVVRKQYIRDTQEYFKILNEIDGIKQYPSQANFALLELKSGILADDFAFGLLVKSGVYTRTCSDKIGLDGEFIRLVSRSAIENKEIITAIKEAL
jgi:histidinol-phosphate/aromatic aminotransferase/cobyric acid decarboxylase-like protein